MFGAYNRTSSGRKHHATRRDRASKDEQSDRNNETITSSQVSLRRRRRLLWQSWRQRDSTRRTWLGELIAPRRPRRQLQHLHGSYPPLLLLLLQLQWQTWLLMTPSGSSNRLNKCFRSVTLIIDIFVDFRKPAEAMLLAMNIIVDNRSIRGDDATVHVGCIFCYNN